MSNRDDMLKKFRAQEEKCRQAQQERECRQQRAQWGQQSRMDNQNNIYGLSWTNTTGQPDRRYTQAEQDERQRQQAMQQQMQYMPPPPKLTEEQIRRRNIAGGAKCVRCGTDDTECWECSGTGITPIPNAEVMSEERVAEAQGDPYNSPFILPQYNYEYKIDHQSIRKIGKDF